MKMNTGSVELKLQDGRAIKIKGSADFVAAVTMVILEVDKGRSSYQASTFKKANLSLSEARAQIDSRDYRQCFRASGKRLGYSYCNESDEHLRLAKLSIF